MRFGSTNLKTVLQLGSFDKRYLIDVYYDGTRVLQDVPVSDVQLNDDSTALVQGSGSLTVVYQDDFARSIAPSDVADLFSPFGTQIFVYVIVSAGPGFTERILLGQYLVSETPSIITTRFLFQGGVVSKGDQIGLTLQDLMYGVQGDQFQVPGSPPQTISTWAEIQRLTGLPLTKTITDGPISATVAYQQDKLQAVYDLANYSLDAIAYMTSDGTVSMRPNVWPDPVDTISWGDQGTLVSVSRGMANDTVYNQVVVRSNDSGSAVLASQEITTGPLRTQNADGSLSPYRRKPYFYSSQYVTTAAQANAYALQQLPRVSKLRSVSVVLTEIFNPLRDLGDVVTVKRLGETFTGRVTQIARTSAATQQTTVAVGQ